MRAYTVETSPSERQRLDDRRDDTPDLERRCLRHIDRGGGRVGGRQLHTPTRTADTRDSGYIEPPADHLPVDHRDHDGTVSGGHRTVDKQDITVCDACFAH